MDASQLPGKYSSPPPPIVDEAAATARLSELAKCARLAPLLAILAPHARVFLVGGVVREALLGSTETDLDLTTSCPVSELVPLLRAAHFHVIETGLHHGTITVAHNGENIEITEFRSGVTGQLGLSLEQDLQLRDFTINAIAFDPLRAVLVDPLHGIADLQAHTLRAAGSPQERFREDPLRLLRAIRFGPAAGRTVQPETEAAMREAAPLIVSVSPERIRVELEKILLSPGIHGAFRLVHQVGILPHILPEMIPAIGFEQNDFHVHDVFEHTLDVIAGTRAERILRWSALFHDLGKPATLSVDERGRRHFYLHEKVSESIAEQVMDRLRFSNHDRDTIRCLVRHHMRPVECGPSGVRRLLRDLGPQFESWREFKLADRPPTMPITDVQARLEKFDLMVRTERERQHTSPFSSLAIDGNDLIALGVAPGPRLGALLKRLAEEVIEAPEINTRESLLARAKALQLE